LTAEIIGVGNIGRSLGHRLVRGGAPVVLSARNESGPATFAGELGPLARAASVEDAAAEVAG
jgi:predicted dinucleotide-binding enzyme